MPKAKKTPNLLLERPPPPTVKELLKDVRDAPANDIAFRRQKNAKANLSHADISEFTIASADEFTDDMMATPDLDDDENAEIDETYAKVKELINLTDKLEKAPEELRTLQKSMNEASKKLDDSVQHLTAKASSHS